MAEKESSLVTESNEFGVLLLDVGIALMQAGASTGRTRILMYRFAEVYQCEPHIIIGSRAISLVLTDQLGNTTFSGIRRTSMLGVDFSIISGVNKLSRMAAEQRLSLGDLSKQLAKYQVPGHYKRIWVLSFVSLAGASFCYNFRGTYIEMAITFGATFFGLFIKQQLTKSKVSPYTCTYAAAVAASVFTGFFQISGLTSSPIIAFSTGVLFLIPGVPLINSFIDLIEGYTSNGIVRGVTALIHVLAIALGLLTTIIILNLKR